MTIDDGYIKYDRSNFTLSTPLEVSEYCEIETWRETLFAKKLIGEYLPEEIGYGNLSQRRDYQAFNKTHRPQFCITSTQTGKLSNLSGEHYTRVVDFDIEKNLIKANGPKEASSEALTHGSIYLSSNDINFVFHIHNKEIWKGMIYDKQDKTPAHIPYGTIDMAFAVKEVINKKTVGHFAMEGHVDGVIIYGRSAEETGALTLEIYNRYC